MKLKLFILIASSTCFSTAPRAADCHIAPFAFGYKGVPFDTSTTMTVTSGKTCGALLHTAFARIRLTILNRPKNGTALTKGSDWWGYASRPGFAGSDSFVVSVEGDRGTSNIRVAVDVTR
jgi:hypothetical protein